MRCDTSVMSRCDFTVRFPMNLYQPRLTTRAISVCQSSSVYVCLCVCVHVCACSACGSLWFKAIWSWIEYTRVQTGNKFQLCHHSALFPMARTQDPPHTHAHTISQEMSKLQLFILFISMTSALPHLNVFTFANQSCRISFQKKISSNLTKVASSFWTWLHKNGANYGASYQNKPEWSPWLKQDLEFRGTKWKQLHV